MPTTSDHSDLRVDANITEPHVKRVMLIRRDYGVTKAGHQQDRRVAAARVGDGAGLLGDSKIALGYVDSELVIIFECPLIRKAGCMVLPFVKK